tara:strand:- start:5022 stop:5990 length:969 start_codon:yes stop_codon:yes gene_type:complete
MNGIVTPEDARDANMPLPSMYQSSFVAETPRLRECNVHHIQTSNNVLLAQTSMVESHSPLDFMQCTGVGARFPAIGIRFPGFTVLGFRTGKMVCTGATTFAEAARGALEHCLLLKRYYGADDPRSAYMYVRRMSITNTVISGYFTQFLSFNSKTPHLRKTEKFPGTYIDDPLLRKIRPKGCSFGAFHSGSFLINKASSLEDATSIIEVLYPHIKPLMVKEGESAPLQWSRDETTSSSLVHVNNKARRTPRKIHQVHIPASACTRSKKNTDSNTPFAPWQTDLAKQIREKFVDNDTFECKTCQVTFTQKCVLQVHKRKHHLHK